MYPYNPIIPHYWLSSIFVFSLHFLPSSSESLFTWGGKMAFSCHLQLNSPGWNMPGQRPSRPGLGLPSGWTPAPPGSCSAYLLPPLHALSHDWRLDLELSRREAFLSINSVFFCLSLCFLLLPLIFVVRSSLSRFLVLLIKQYIGRHSWTGSKKC